MDIPISIRRFHDLDFERHMVNSKSTLTKTIDDIKNKLRDHQLIKFRNSCFGHFLDLDELMFSGQIVNHMLYKQCICDDEKIMEFKFGGSGARFTRQEFGLISGLHCGDQPARRPAPSKRISDKYFDGLNKVSNDVIISVFHNASCNDDDQEDDDRLKLALLLFLETVVLSKAHKSTTEPNHMEMVDDLDFFNSYPWGTLSFNVTIRSLHAAFAHRYSKTSNNSHTYNIIGFPMPFMVCPFIKI